MTLPAPPPLRPVLRDLRPYVIPTGRADWLRLDAAEGPPPPESVLRTLLADAAPDLVRYPEYDRLIAAAARHYGADPAGVLPVNGADEGIRWVVQAFCEPSATLVTSWPCFSMYAIYGRLHGAAVRAVSARPDGSADLAALTAAVAEADLTVVASPENPTGAVLTPSDLDRLVHATAGRPLLLDETYAEFCGQDYVPLLRQYPNLMILRTLSKAQGVPGLRCGFLLAGPELGSALRVVGSPYNVSAVAARLAERLMSWDTGQAARLAAAVAARVWLQERFTAAGVSTLPSRTHFFVADLTEPDRALALHAHLRQAGILIRVLDGDWAGRVRISVADRTEAEACWRSTADWLMTGSPAEAAGTGGAA